MTIVHTRLVKSYLPGMSVVGIAHGTARAANVRQSWVADHAPLATRGDLFVDRVAIRYNRLGSRVPMLEVFR